MDTCRVEVTITVKGEDGETCSHTVVVENSSVDWETAPAILGQVLHTCIKGVFYHRDDISQVMGVLNTFMEHDHSLKHQIPTDEGAPE